MLRRIAMGLGCLLGAVVLGVPLWIQTHRADLPDARDADLTAPVVLAAGPDGFDELRAAAAAADDLAQEAIYTRIESIRTRKAWEPEFVEEQVARHLSAFAALERAIAAPQGAIPFPFAATPADSLDEAMDVLFRVHLLAKLAACEAQLLDRGGAHERALDRALLGLRLGHRISEFDNPSLIVMLMAVSMQAISVMELEVSTQGSPSTVASAGALAARLGTHRIRAKAWETTWATEYHWSKRLLLGGVYEGQGVLLPEESLERWVRDDSSPAWFRWVPADYLFQPNRTLATYAETYRDQQRKSSRSCRGLSVSEPRLEALDRLRMLAMPNPSGSLFLAIVSPNFDRFQLRRCHGDARLALLQAAIAARAYAHAHGELPEGLDVLVPGFLATVPIDPFDGAPVRYSKQRGVVRSVGDDLREDPDTFATELSRTAEPSIRVAL